MGKVLQVRISVAAVRESERLCAVSPVQVPQQEEPAAVSAEIRRDLLRRTTETRADSPHKKEIPMTPVSHGKPCAGNPHARFDEGASASEEPRRKALLHVIRRFCLESNRRQMRWGKSHRAYMVGLRGWTLESRESVRVRP